MEQNVMVGQDPLQFIADLQLEQPHAGFMPVQTKGVEEELVKDHTAQSFISDKSVLSFVSDVSGVNRVDVLNSTLLAQLAANKQFAIETHVQEWYNAFLDVLKKIGWQVEEMQVGQFEAKDDLFEVENVVLDILLKAFGSDFIGIIQNTIDSMKELSDEGSGKIAAFQRNAHAVTKGCFQIGLVVEKNNAISMQLATFMLTASNEIKKILFVKFSKDRTKLSHTYARATLNLGLYDTVRDAVTAKLGDKMRQCLAEIEL